MNCSPVLHEETEFEIFNDADAAAIPDAVVHHEEAIATREMDLALPRRALFPQRPGYGSLGQSNILQTNLLSVKIGNKKLFCYGIRIKNTSSGQRPGAMIARRVISKFISENVRQGLYPLATDYHSLVVSCSEITCEQPYQVIDQTPYTYSGVIYEIYFQHIYTLHGKNFINQSNCILNREDAESQSLAIKVLDVLLGQLARKNALSACTAANSPFYVHTSPGSNILSSLRAGMEMQQRLSIRIYPTASRSLVKVGSRCLPYYQAGSLSAVIQRYIAKHTSRVELGLFLKGLRVHLVTPIDSYEDQVFDNTVNIISGLARCTDGALLQHPPRVARYGAGPHEVEVFQTPRRSTQSKRRHPRGYVKLVAYFEQEYNITLNRDIPVVNVGTEQHPVYLPAELCFVDAGQPARASFANLRHSAGQTQTWNEISDVVNSCVALGLNGPLDPLLGAFGVRASPNPITVYSRTLPKPRVLYARNKAAHVIQGAWSAHSFTVIKPATLAVFSWIYLDFELTDMPSKSTAPLKGLRQLKKVLQHMGIGRSVSMFGGRVQLKKRNTKTQIKAAISFLKAKYCPAVLLVISPTRARTFACFARLACDIIYGIPAIDVPEEWLASVHLEVHARISLRINLKLGGVNHVVSKSDLDFFANGKTMIVGIKAVYATSYRTKPAHTIVGLVTSWDSCLAQWPAETSVQQGRHQYHLNLDVMLQSSIRYWAKNKNCLPEDIIIYRHMASDSNYVSWSECELPLIKAACRNVDPVADRRGRLPRIAIVLVEENHEARFFPTIDTEAYGSGSPQPGTVVDRGISDPHCWDFFLQSHHSISATDNPTRYFVIMDEVFRRRGSKIAGHRPADLLQDLTHKLCYLSGESTKAKSTCTPIYYASQACERLRSYLHLFHRPSASNPQGDKNTDGEASSLLKIHPVVRGSMFYL